MTLGSLSRLVRLSLARDKGGTGFSAFGVGVGICSLVFFVALGSGVGDVVRERVFPVDATLVDVVPPTLSLGAVLGGGKLDASVVARIAALPGVVAVHPKMNARMPAVTRYEGSFFGSQLRMGLEILAVGVEPALVRKDVELGDFSDPGPGKPIPALIARRLLEIYDKTFAPARQLPQISPQMVIGFTFPIEFNRSFVAASPAGPVIPGQIQVVGVSDRALLAGITIPLDVAKRLNRTAGADADTFTGLTVQAADPGIVPSVVAAVKEMGLQVDDQERRLAQNAGVAVALTTSALALLSVLICVIAAVNIAHALSASVRARAKEIGVMRAVGASRGDVRNIVLAEAAVVGLIGGGLGTLGAWGAAKAVDALSASYLRNLPFKPDSFFSFSPVLLAGGAALGVLAALAGAYLPSRRAAATDPARTLAG